MDQVDQGILKLRAEGKSLRTIAAALSMSHEAVRKRLKSLANDGEVSTKASGLELTPATGIEEMMPTGSYARKARDSGQPRHPVNRVSTSKPPCLTPTEGVNPRETHAERSGEGKKGVFSGVVSETNDLLGTIKDFLESKQIEVYRMQSVPECYQVKHNGQTIRFYINRGKLERSQSPGMDERPK